MRLRDIALVGAAIFLFVIGWLQEAPINFDLYCHLLEAEPDFSLPPKPVVATVEKITLVKKGNSFDSVRTQHRYLFSSGLGPENGNKVYFYNFFKGSPLIGDNTFYPCDFPSAKKANSTVVKMNERVVGLGFGSLSSELPTNDVASIPKEEFSFTGTSRNAAVAVVTEEYVLSLFTVDGKLLWKAEVLPHGYRNAVVQQASVTIVPERLYRDDVGMVVVVMPMETANGAPYMVYAAFNGLDGSLRWRYLSDKGSYKDDVIEEIEDLADAETAVGGRDGDLFKAPKFNENKQDPEQKVDEVPNEDKVENPVEDEGEDEEIPTTTTTSAPAKKKKKRVRKAAKGERKAETAADPEVKESEIVPFISRTYEQPWSTYRRGVLSALPHRYDHPWDESLSTSVFYRMKGRQTEKTNRPFEAKRESKLAFYFHDHETGNSEMLRMDDDDYDVLGEKLSLWKTSLSARKIPRMREPSNTLVFHSRDGIEVLHLYTGDVLTRLSPLRSEGVYYDDVNDDDYIEMLSNYIDLTGLEKVEGYCGGARECLGIIDTGVPGGQQNLLEVTICDTVGFFGSFSVLHDYVDGEAAEDHYHADITKGKKGLLSKLEMLGSKNIMNRQTTAITPLSVQTHYRRMRNVVQVERLALFMVDSGLITCVDPLRHRVRWRAETMAQFGASAPIVEEDAGKKNPGAARDEEEEKDRAGSPFPHLVPYHPFAEDAGKETTGGMERYNRPSSHVLAVGQLVASLVRLSDGHVQQNIELPCVPVAPVLVEDMNGDGIQDLLITCTSGIYIYSGSMSGGSTHSVAILIMLMFALVGLLFLVREVSVVLSVEEVLDGVEGEEAAQLRAQERRAFKRATD